MRIGPTEVLGVGQFKMIQSILDLHLWIEQVAAGTISTQNNVCTQKSRGDKKTTDQ